jgi:GST-like protein
MITLYTYNTPNGRKISVALEEMGLPYEVKVIDIGKGEQFSPDFLKIAPNNKIPAIVDSEGPDGQPISVFESAPSCTTWPRRPGSSCLPTPRPRGRHGMADVADGGLRARCRGRCISS